MSSQTAQAYVVPAQQPVQYFYVEQPVKYVQQEQPVQYVQQGQPVQYVQQGQPVQSMYAPVETLAQSMYAPVETVVQSMYAPVEKLVQEVPVQKFGVQKLFNEMTVENSRPGNCRRFLPLIIGLSSFAAICAIVLGF